MLWIVIGGQFGSEGKGAIIAWLSTKGRPKEASAIVGVRIGGPNAGHSVLTEDSQVLKMRHIPCTFLDRKSPLCIARGALIDLEVLHGEIAEAERAGYSISDRLYIAPEAVVIQPQDRDYEFQYLRERIGSTAEGVGSARASLVMRKAKLAADEPSLEQWIEPNTATILRGEATRPDTLVILETTQGYGLSLQAAGYYPYCTSRDITPAQALNDAGLPSLIKHQVLAIFRTFPIRVAGNSGPLTEETTWEELAKESGGYIQPEQTTVTKKTRRVGRWDPTYNMKAIAELQPTAVALTFYDYVRPDLVGATALDKEAEKDITRRELELDAYIKYVSLGFQQVVKR